MAAKNIYCFNRKCLCANCVNYCPMCEHSMPHKCDDGVHECEYYEQLSYEDYLMKKGYEYSTINRDEYYFKEG